MKARLCLKPPLYLSFDELKKALQHKYIKKVRNGVTKTGKPKWRYIYAESKTKAKGAGGDLHRHGIHKIAAHLLEVKDSQLQKGASFSAGKNKGHFIIDSVQGDMVHFHIDDTDGRGTKGQPILLEKDEFKKRVYRAHKEGARLHAAEGMTRRLDVLKRARAVNPEGIHAKRAAAEVERWKTVHEERLPPSKLTHGATPDRIDRVKREIAEHEANNAKLEAARASAEARRKSEKIESATSDPFGWGDDPVTMNTVDPLERDISVSKREDTEAKATNKALYVEAIRDIVKNKEESLSGAYPVTSTPPNIWDLSPSAIRELKERQVLSYWESDFLTGKRFKSLSEFSPKQQEIIGRIQENLENTWDKLKPEKREWFSKDAIPETGAGDQSLETPNILKIPEKARLQLKRDGVINGWEAGFLDDNSGKRFLSDKQQSIVSRIQATFNDHWKNNLTLEKQEKFYSDYGVKGSSEVKAQEDVARAKEAEQKEKAKSAKEDGSFSLPKGMKKFADRGYKLHEYQNKFINWVNETPRALGALETGLGKTVGTIASFHHLKEAGKIDHMVVVAPLSALATWIKETSKFSDAKVALLHGTLAKRKKMLEAYKLGEYDVLLTTYGTARKDHEQIAAAKPDGKKSMLVMDEAHYLKDPSTQQAKALANISSKNDRVIGLTATPQPNKAEELFAVVNAVSPGYMGTNKWQFARKYANIIENRFGKTIDGYKQEALPRLHKDLDSVMFVKRRNDPDVKITLPERHQISVNVGMDKKTAAAYNNQILAMIKDIESKEGKINPLTNLLRLRQISVSPGLLTPGYKGESHKIQAVADAAINHISNYPERGAVIFGEFNGGLDLSRQALLDRGVPEHKIGAITGATTAKQRAKIQDDLNGGKIQYLLANIKAMQTGANLQENANFVATLDLPWNPATLTQAVDRVHRQGQEFETTVYHPISSPVEERQMQMLVGKLESSAQALQGKGASEEKLAESLKITTTKKGFIEFLESLKVGGSK